MTKLIKPVMIDNIIRSGVVLKSKKAYKEISKLELTNLCAIRAHDNIKINIMKTRKHFIRKYELLARCIQTNLELFILQ